MTKGDSVARWIGPKFIEEHGTEQGPGDDLTLVLPIAIRSVGFPAFPINDRRTKPGRGQRVRVIVQMLSAFGHPDCSESQQSMGH